MEHKYLIWIANSIDSVSYRNACFPRHHPVEGLLHFFLVCTVKSRRSLVEKEDIRSAKDDSSDSDSLFLSTRNMRTFDAYIFVESCSIHLLFLVTILILRSFFFLLWFLRFFKRRFSLQYLIFRVEVTFIGSRYNFFLSGLGSVIFDVITDSFVE